MKKVLLVISVAFWPAYAHSQSQGTAVVRVDDPSGSHCIDANAEDVTLHLRRVFTQRRSGLFTRDNRAGVVVTATLTGRGSGQNVTVKIPSVTLVDVRKERRGRVSLPLEYQIASYLTLKQDKFVATDLQLAISLATTRGRNTFGEILDVAGKALNKFPIPNNPFGDVTNKILDFANDAINSAANDQAGTFAEVSLAFNLGSEPNIDKCKAAGKERTGAVAVLRSTGSRDGNLVPVVNTDQRYCFKYSTTATYELLAAQKSDGKCPASDAAYQGVNNDYVMFILSAAPTVFRQTMKAHDLGITDAIARLDQELKQPVDESRKRCQALRLPPSACGIPE